MRSTTVDQLGDFLRTRRASLTPEELGLATHGRRRVPGLRRDEVADLTGLSLTYYTRLEQGAALNPSDQVLDALARALRLPEVERLHLFELARAARPVRAPAGEEEARPGLVSILDAMPDAPALLLGRSHDILAWNRLGHALLGDGLPFNAPPDRASRPNKIRQIFLAAGARALYREWEREADLAVASLRFTAARFPDDPKIARLIGELSLASTDFARIWAEHPVELCINGIKRYHHPLVGRLDLAYEVLDVPGDDGQRLLIHTATSGSTDEDALRLLASTILTR